MFKLITKNLKLLKIIDYLQGQVTDLTLRLENLESFNNSNYEEFYKEIDSHE